MSLASISQNISADVPVDIQLSSDGLVSMFLTFQMLSPTSVLSQSLIVLAGDFNDALASEPYFPRFGIRCENSVRGLSEFDASLLTTGRTLTLILSYPYSIYVYSLHHNRKNLPSFVTNV